MVNKRTPDSGFDSRRPHWCPRRGVRCTTRGPGDTGQTGASAGPVGPVAYGSHKLGREDGATSPAGSKPAASIPGDHGQRSTLRAAPCSGLTRDTQDSRSKGRENVAWPRRYGATRKCRRNGRRWRCRKHSAVIPTMKPGKSEGPGRIGERVRLPPLPECLYVRLSMLALT